LTSFQSNYCVEFRFRDLSCCPLQRASPLPRLKWAEPDLLWKSLLKQDLASKSLRGEEMFARNPQVQPRMRSILLDWLIEVLILFNTPPNLVAHTYNSAQQIFCLHFASCLYYVSSQVVNEALTWLPHEI
jgi:hypothetical protein